MYIERFEDIKAWQLAKDLTVKVYQLKCKTDYGIDVGFKDQIQRACVSVMSNIAEGFESGSNKSIFKRYLMIAKGSAGELRSLFIIGKEVGYISQNEFEYFVEKIEEISKLIYGLFKSLN